MMELAGQTRDTLKFKDIMTNQEKLKEFDMRLLKNQQNLILNNGNKTSEYLFALSKLLKKKEKSHYLKRKGLKDTLSKRKTSSLDPETEQNIQNNFNNLVDEHLSTHDLMSNINEITSESGIFEKEDQNKEMSLSSNEEFNYSHKNDYLESDFSFTDQHDKKEKEKVVFQKLREKYNFYPRMDPSPVFDAKELTQTRNDGRKSLLGKSVKLDAKATLNAPLENLVSNQNAKSMIFSRTGLAFKNSQITKMKSFVSPKEQNLKGKNCLPLIKNLKSIQIQNEAVLSAKNIKQSKQEIKSAKKVLERVFRFSELK